MSRKCVWLMVFALALAWFAGLARAQTVYINFQSRTAGDGAVPEGYLPDYGDVFGDRGNGWSYGWDADLTGQSRDRDNAIAPDQRYDTCNHIGRNNATWEIEIENGVYDLFLVCGDSNHTDQTNNLDVEGVIVEDPDGEDNFDEYELTVTVSDGRLTISPAEGQDNAKVMFIDIVLAIAPEAARSPDPEKEAVDIPRDLTVGWEPGEGVSAHDIYLGASFDDVNNASRTNPMDVLLSEGQAATTLDVGRLEFSQTYYWRVDSVLADGIYKNEVWSFTVEPFAYETQNVTASTNATSDAGLGIENTINGSGLNEAGQHSTESTDMWLGMGEAPVVIEYAFDAVYKLDEMLVWNYNEQFEVFLGYGLKDVTVEYSADGETWTLLGDVEVAQATVSSDYEANTAIDFGGAAVKMVRITVNANHGVLPQYGLSEVRFMYIPATAREPQPDDGATGVSVNTALSWRAGREAATHDVYLGTDAEALDLADSVSEASYAAELTFGTTYYWKVDEVNEAEAISVWPGSVWSFVAEEFAVIDDFESYDDEDNRIYDTWLDGFVNGSGATVGYFEAPFAETSIVNSGAQSMPLEYDNSVAPFYSEAEFDLGSLDLTANGADSLRLFFRGNPVDFLERADGSIAMGAAGADIWGTADEFRFAYKSLNGDGEIVARVDSIDNVVNNWAKAGVMIRETLDAGARNTFMAMTGSSGGGATFQNRPASNVASASQHTLPGNPFAPPYYVKITRVGDDFSGFISPDGATWQQAGDTVTVTMGANVFVGLAVTSHDSGSSVGVNFSEVAITGNVTGGWTAEAIGVEMASNDPDQLYVAIEDTSGNVDVVVHPDPAAVGSADWTEWVIPLSELGTINPARASVLYVGVGDRDNPSAAGTGTVFIDDIGYGSPAPEPAADE